MTFVDVLFFIFSVLVFYSVAILYSVERLYCKRTIQCLASSIILILTPTHFPARRVRVPPRLWCGVRIHSLGGEGGEGSIFWKTPDTALYSTYVSTLCCPVFSKLCTGFTLYNAVNYRINMELDRQSLFGLHMHNCTHWLRARKPPQPPTPTRARLLSYDRRHLFVTPMQSTHGTSIRKEEPK
jgi:hypothetical protein